MCFSGERPKVAKVAAAIPERPPAGHRGPKKPRAAVVLEEGDAPAPKAAPAPAAPPQTLKQQYEHHYRNLFDHAAQGYDDALDRMALVIGPTAALAMATEHDPFRKVNKLEAAMKAQLAQEHAEQKSANEPQRTPTIFSDTFRMLADMRKKMKQRHKDLRALIRQKDPTYFHGVDPSGRDEGDEKSPAVGVPAVAPGDHRPPSGGRPQPARGRQGRQGGRQGGQGGRRGRPVRQERGDRRGPRQLHRGRALPTYVPAQRVSTSILAAHRERKSRRESAKHIPRHSRHMQNRSMYGADSMTPNLSIVTVAPGHYRARVRRGVTQGVRRQIQALLKRAPAMLFVNGRKLNKRRAYQLILDLLRQRSPVEIMLN